MAVSKGGLYYIMRVCGFWGKPVMQEKEEVIASRGNCKEKCEEKALNMSGKA